MSLTEILRTLCYFFILMSLGHVIVPFRSLLAFIRSQKRIYLTPKPKGLPLALLGLSFCHGDLATGFCDGFIQFIKLREKND